MKLSPWIKGISLLLLFVFAGCTATGSALQSQGGSEAGNPDGGVSFSVVGYSSTNNTPSQSKFQSLSLPGMDIQAAQLVLERIELRPLSVCTSGSEEGNEFRFEGLFPVDLLIPPPIPELEGISVPAGLYCRLEIRLARFEDESESEELNGHSILVTGSRQDGVPFKLSLSEDEEFKLENETSGFLIDPENSLNRFFIAFDLAQWFSGVDLNDPGVEVSDDGSGNPIIYIDEDHNEVLQKIIVDNLEESSDLFGDEDDDGELDDFEQENPLAEGTII